MQHTHLDINACVDETVAAVRTYTASAPVIGIVLGSGLGAYADALQGLLKVPYTALPHMPGSKVVGHAGNLCFGLVNGTSVVCMQGRAHPYEGHPLWQAVHGARVMARLGAQAVLLTNAAGGLDTAWAPGDLMAITDHLNLTGQSLLVGENDAALGPRFPDMSEAYDKRILAALARAAASTGITLREGVYAGLMGPTYETPAEICMLQLLGAKAVGMSTVHEVVALRHMGVRVGALSCITNLGAGLGHEKLEHSDVEAVAKTRHADLIRLLDGWIGETAKELS